MKKLFFQIFDTAIKKSLMLYTIIVIASSVTVITSTTKNITSNVLSSNKSFLLNTTAASNTLLLMLNNSSSILTQKKDNITTFLQTSTYLSSITTCLHMNDVLWQYHKDTTTLPLVKTLFALFYSLIIIFGVAGNLCVVLSISRTRFVFGFIIKFITIIVKKIFSV